MRSDLDGMSAFAALTALLAAAEDRRKREERDTLRAEVVVPKPVVYTAGRNDPCPCGSGKKYKKCCRP